MKADIEKRIKDNFSIEFNKPMEKRSMKDTINFLIFFHAYIIRN